MLNQRGVVLVATSAVLTFLGLATVAFRVYARAVLVRNFGWDDGMMVASMILSLVYLSTVIWMVVRFNLGVPGSQLDTFGETGILQATFAIQLEYLTTLFTLKASIIFLYLRLAIEHSWLRRLCQFTLAFLVLALVESIVVTCVQCTPIQLAWDVTGAVRGTCINRTAFFYTTSAYNIALDTWILALPIKTLVALRMPGREKSVLLAVFLMGVFATVSSIVRLYTIALFTLSKDPFFDAVPINQWSIIEVNVAIICASIPTLKPLLSKSTRDRIISSRSRSNRHGAYAKGGSDSVSWPNNYKGEPLSSPGIELKKVQVRESELPRDMESLFEALQDDVEQGHESGGIRRTTTVQVRRQG